jgi:vacuolar-type H+-ATPase subunit H
MDADITSKLAQISSMITESLPNIPAARHTELHSLRDAADREYREYKQAQEDARKRLLDSLERYRQRVDDTRDRLQKLT